MTRGRTLLYGLAAVVCLAVICVLPHLVPYYYQDLLVFLVINILLASSYRLLALAGEWSLIHVVMMGCGAYTSALLTIKLGLPFWVALPLGGVVAAAVAFVLSFPLFRMKVFYFLIGSFAAGEAIRLCWNVFNVPFGGPQGLQPIPGPQLGDIPFWNPVNYYYMSLIFVGLSLLVLYRLEKSRFGLTLHAIHWSDSLCESVGVEVWRHKMLAFVISSFFAGICGVLAAHYIGTITPTQFTVSTMVTVLVWVIVGGTGTFFGPIIGVIALTFLDEWLRVFGLLRLLAYGALLIVFTLFLPDGLESIPGRISRGVRAWRDGRLRSDTTAHGRAPGTGERG